MKTLIFDFDGTLGDSFELAIDIAVEITGMPRASAEKIDHLRRLPLLRAIKEIGVPFRKIPGLIVKGRQRMLERMNEVAPFDGIPEVLKSLHAAGYHLLVISSNSEKNVRSFLRTNNLEPYFDGVYGSASIFNKALTLKKVIRRNKLEVADCFYIGDEVRDIVAAARVGVEPVAVAWGYQAAEALQEYHPYALLDHPKELMRIFPIEKV